jgi:hypothetical protein
MMSCLGEPSQTASSAPWDVSATWQLRTKGRLARKATSVPLAPTLGSGHAPRGLSVATARDLKIKVSAWYALPAIIVRRHQLTRDLFCLGTISLIKESVSWKDR